jgi:hypothetical protein
VKRKSLAIATPVGSFKGAFAHGVLTALEQAGIVADAYASASSSVLPASWAAIGRSSELGVEYWLAGLSALQQPDANMSKVVQRGIRVFGKPLRQHLYQPHAPTLYIDTIRPDLHLKELGVDFTKATPDGLVAVYQHGQAKGSEFINQWHKSV